MKADTIVLHCSATEEGKRFTFEQCKEYHISKGWRTIGYHVYVEVDGSVYFGRNFDEMGAGVSGHNSHTIHICYEGGLSAGAYTGGAVNWAMAKDTRTQSQKAAIYDVIRTYIEAHGGVRYICGHRDFPRVIKQCPSFDAITEYRWIVV